MKAAFHADADPAQQAPRERRRYPCLARGCPMPGVIFLNGHDAPGICAFHLDCNASDMPRIADVLRNWECVTHALETARRFLTDPHRCGDVKAERTLLVAQWRELSRQAPDWTQLDPAPESTLGDWALQLLAFLVWRVDNEVRGRASAWQWPPAMTRTVADMLTRFKPSRGNAGDALC